MSLEKAGAYHGYADWKGWRAPFNLSHKQRKYFEGEIGIGPVQGKKVLELGFGEGAFLAWCAENGAEVYGIELLEELVESGREQGFRTFSEAGFPWAEHTDSFDLVVGLDVLEHLDLAQVESVLAHIARVTRQGGRHFFRFPNGQSPFGRIFQYGDVTHKSVLSGPVLGQLCHALDLRLVRAKKPYFPVIDRPLRRKPLRPVKRLWSLFLESLLIGAVARGLGIHKYVLAPNVVVVLEKP